MQAGATKLSVEAVLYLNEEEVAMLNHLASYGAGFAEIIFNSVSTRYAPEALNVLFTKLRTSTDSIMSAARDARQHLFDRT